MKNRIPAIHVLLTLLLTTGLLIACDEEEVCDQSVYSSLNIGFYKSGDGKQDTSVQNFSCYGLGADSMLYDIQNNLSRLALPLNPSTRSCSFVMIFDSIPDTLIFSYDQELVFVSYPCGFAPHYSITENYESHNVIDSITIENSEVNPQSEENVKIYL
ncbi:MAG: hypothetical protein K9G67_09260 [Bacteroidales bacterium]|nr:hypothetical protein [Bacteroidales bacterium]MCF8350649.1 hypothetical protein [Bacteroidales bacterium]MCF8376529.1 hypothetical protein [Bacteroidales bacterium]MCF8400619.1 hypothetical protein [Bacteroidales bacterium]